MSLLLEGIGLKDVSGWVYARAIGYAILFRCDLSPVHNSRECWHCKKRGEVVNDSGWHIFGKTVIVLATLLLAVALYYAVEVVIILFIAIVFRIGHPAGGE
jgi:hypothetical protein